MEENKIIKKQCCILLDEKTKIIGVYKANMLRKSFAAYITDLILKDNTAPQKEENNVCSSNK